MIESSLRRVMLREAASGVRQNVSKIRGSGSTLSPVVSFRAADAFFVVAAAALGLLLIGIHNAWDTVTDIVMSGSSRDDSL